MAFVYIKPGSFRMGSPEDEEGRDVREHLHPVGLGNGFYLGQHNVTQAQWTALMGTNQSQFKGDDRPVDLQWPRRKQFLPSTQFQFQYEHFLLFQCKPFQRPQF